MSSDDDSWEAVNATLEIGVTLKVHASAGLDNIPTEIVLPFTAFQLIHIHLTVGIDPLLGVI